jgi:Fe-S-cluster containining protein
MESTPILYPLDLHFSCHTCAGCCRGLDVYLSDDEAKRFTQLDWPTLRPRLAGRDLMRPAGEGLYKLEHMGDACVFLDEDNLCAIHKELGLEAKPFMCKQFPSYLGSTPEGIIATFDFACPVVVADEGAPIQQQEHEIRTRIAEWQVVGPALRGAIAGATLGGEEPHVLARRGVPLAWADYLALEAGLQHVLTSQDRPLTERLLTLDSMAVAAAEHAEPGAMQGWVKDLESERWAALSTTAPKLSPLRQRAVVASSIAAIEGAWGQRAGERTSAGSRVSLATALVPARRPIRLATAGATVALDRMRETGFAQDDPALTGPIVRFLLAFLARKSLIAGTSVLQGSRYLALYFATIRWYSVARAVMAERAAAEVADVRYAIRLIEQTLSRSPSLRSPRFVSLVNFLFDRIAPANALYPSPYPV